jgi:hypothetical protein
LREPLTLSIASSAIVKRMGGVMASRVWRANTRSGCRQEAVGGTFDRSAAPIEDMGVDHRCRDVVMAE